MRIARRTQALQAIPRDLNMAIKLKPIVVSEQRIVVVGGGGDVVVPPPPPEPFCPATTAKGFSALVNATWLGGIRHFAYSDALNLTPTTIPLPPACPFVTVEMVGCMKDGDCLTWEIATTSPDFASLVIEDALDGDGQPRCDATIVRSQFDHNLPDGATFTLVAKVNGALIGDAIVFVVDRSAHATILDAWQGATYDISTGGFVLIDGPLHFTFTEFVVTNVVNQVSPFNGSNSTEPWLWWNSPFDFTVTSTQLTGPTMRADLLPVSCNSFQLDRDAGSYAGTSYEFQMLLGGSAFGVPVTLTCEV